MKFSDYPYQRPDLNTVQANLNTLTSKLEAAINYEEALKTVESYFKTIDAIDTQMQLVFIRHSMDTSNKFYNDEQAFVDKTLPLIESFTVRFTNSLLKSPFKERLEKRFGKLLFEKARLSQKTFDDKIISDLQLENKYTTEYIKLRSSAKIPFDNQIFTLAQIAPYTTHQDQKVRMHASKAVSKWFKDNEQAFDTIYDNLVKTRHEIATKLGYDNFIELAYDRLRRVDYDAKDVAGYRKQILEKIVPYVNNLMMRRKKRLGLKKLMSYDLGLNFLSGNPTPKGDRKWQVEQAIKMYDALSPETSKFFRFMVDKELMDLDSRANKEGGGYCTYIPDHQSPFIFANFNGTSGDVDVLTHEAGHAFQVYMSKNLIPEYRWPG